MARDIEKVRTAMKSWIVWAKMETPSYTYYLTGRAEAESQKDAAREVIITQRRDAVPRDVRVVDLDAMTPVAIDKAWA